MQVGECFYLGVVSKIIGKQGELAFKLDVDSPSSYKNLSHVWLQMHQKDENLIPFFTESVQLQNDGSLRVKLEGVNSKDEAAELQGKGLFLSIKDLPPLKGNQFYFHEILGFEIIDQEKGNLGKVEKVLEYSTSNLFSILHPSGKEVLIPINDDTILEVNRDQKEITVKSPEGLIDLYLES